MVIVLIVASVVGHILSKSFNDFMHSLYTVYIPYHVNPINCITINVSENVGINLIGAIVPLTVSSMLFVLLALRKFSMRRYLVIFLGTFLVFMFSSGAVGAQDLNELIYGSVGVNPYYQLGFFPAALIYLLFSYKKGKPTSASWLSDWVAIVLASFSISVFSVMAIHIMAFQAWLELSPRWKLFDQYEFGRYGTSSIVMLLPLDSSLYATVASVTTRIMVLVQRLSIWDRLLR